MAFPSRLCKTLVAQVDTQILNEGKTKQKTAALSLRKFCIKLSWTDSKFMGRYVLDKKNGN